MVTEPLETKNFLTAPSSSYTVTTPGWWGEGGVKVGRRWGEGGVKRGLWERRGAAVREEVKEAS